VIVAGHALCPASSLHGGELKRSQSPQGDKTLHFDTIWILKGKNAAQVDFVLLVFNVVCMMDLCV
jgi:hypothetical protein